MRMLPKEMGLGSGVTCWRRLRDWQTADVWLRLFRGLLNRLGKTGRLDWDRACLDSPTIPAKRGGGPNPTDRGKPGSKRYLVTDRNGTPLATVLTGANVHDSWIFEDRLDAIEPIKSPRGRLRKRPEKLHADKGYDFRRCRQALRNRGISSRIARKGKESSERLGRHRWVVERTLAWMARYRRLTVRYERRA